jgi:crossover junction endodeoxyribonuclease RuvC
MSKVISKVIKERIILGMDPGTTIMGYGVILVKQNKISLLQYGVIKLSKYPDHAMKLTKIFERVVQLIEEYLPDEVAIEAPFFGVNVQSMLKLGRAQGVAMAAALSRDVPIVEYAPKKIKMAVTGNGNASKEQVAAMVERLVGQKLEAEFFDATDALAVAICHYFKNGESEKSAKGWGQFLKDNPNRLKS